jgi:DNA invertase Pin-like site-specific DNA recombinase
MLMNTLENQMGEVVGYIRVSSVDQNTARQLDGVNVDKMFEDKCSGKDTQRPQLQAMLSYVREGDTVVVHDISRLARNLQDLLGMVKSLNKKGVTVKFDKENLEFTGTPSPMNDLMLSLLGAVYQFERSMIKERQLEGVALAKAAGAYKGGKARLDAAAILAALADGMSIRGTAAHLNVSVSSVQRVKALASEAV